MVKVRTPGRAAFRTPPITTFFPLAQNNNNNSTEKTTPVSSKHDNENLSYNGTTPSKRKSIRKNETQKRNKLGHTTPETPLKSLNVTPETPLKSLQVNDVKIPKIPKKTRFQLESSDDDDDDLNGVVPDIIEDDEDDDLLSKAEFNGSSEILRRSKRSRHAVAHEGFVSTVDAVPMKGDIPMLDASPSDVKVSSNTKRTYQNSLSSLLREKKIREKAGYDINAMEQALQHDMLDEMEDPYSDYDRLEISASILNENGKFEQLHQILEEDDKLDQNHHIEFFETLHSNPQISDLKTVMIINDDPIFDLLLRVSSDKGKLKYILCNDWIVHQYQTGWQVPTEVIVWLLHLASYEEDETISEASFNTLKNIAEIKGTCYNTDLKNEAEDIKVPFLEVYNILVALGASTKIISLRCHLEKYSKKTALFEVPEVPSKFNYVHNIRFLLKALAPMISSRLFTFSSPAEIRLSINVLLRLPLDQRLLSLSNEVEKVVDSLLTMFKEDQWTKQAKLLCNDFELSCGSITQYKVNIIENLPISNRGRLLKRFLAIRFLFGSKSPLSQQMNILNVTEPGILKSLLDVLQDNSTIFKIKDETNYNDLYYYILLLNHALDDESQLRNSKDTVEEIIQKLKFLHGKIVDMRAAFMDRTKTKDLIQRLYMRLYYISSHQRRKIQTSIDLFKLGRPDFRST